MTSLYPLRFWPIYKNYLWGGRKFATVFGRKLPSDDVFAESWETADHPAGRCVVANGPAVGKPLKTILAQAGRELLGSDARHGSRFPILLKFIDAAKPLSVQVHPSDDLAQDMQLPDVCGKSEAWVVLDADPGSTIWAGFQSPVDRETVLASLKRGQFETLLHRFEPQVGDCLYLPAGTVHALGGGVLLAEVQQMSNNTFRLYDWGRTCSQGKARPLHIGAALASINYDQGPMRPLPGFFNGQTTGPLLSCDHFEIHRWQLASTEFFPDDGRCHVIAVLRGRIEIDDGTLVQRLGMGDTVVLPASRRRTRCMPDGPCTLIDVTTSQGDRDVSPS